MDVSGTSLRTWMPAIRAGMTAFCVFVGERKTMSHSLVHPDSFVDAAARHLHHLYSDVPSDGWKIRRDYPGGQSNDRDGHHFCRCVIAVRKS
jgi:hypothetical protein